MTDTKHTANAHLIAAAPELLEALRLAEDALLRAMPTAPGRAAHEAAIKAARAAIAKAEGR